MRFKSNLVLLSAFLLTSCSSGLPWRSMTSWLTSTSDVMSPRQPGNTMSADNGNQQLTIFAAASLKDAFQEIGQGFEAAHLGVKVTFNFAGSQTLSTQLTLGAAADVFASANHAEMDKLITAGLVAKEAPMDFLSNRLVVILPPNNPAKIESLQDLARAGLKVIVANQAVPAGKYTLEALKNMNADPSFGVGFMTLVLNNIVSKENDVKLVVAKVQLGEADAGFAYFSDTVPASQLKFLEIPDRDNVVARYPIAVLKDSIHVEMARNFLDYVLSPAGQEILKKWGFDPISRQELTG